MAKEMAKELKEMEKIAKEVEKSCERAAREKSCKNEQQRSCIEKKVKKELRKSHKRIFKSCKRASKSIVSKACEIQKNYKLQIAAKFSD